jgi:hypothetical protein
VTSPSTPTASIGASDEEQAAITRNQVDRTATILTGFTARFGTIKCQRGSTNLPLTSRPMKLLVTP